MNNCLLKKGKNIYKLEENDKDSKITLFRKLNKNYEALNINEQYCLNRLFESLYLTIRMFEDKNNRHSNDLDYSEKCELRKYLVIYLNDTIDNRFIVCPFLPACFIFNINFIIKSLKEFKNFIFTDYYRYLFTELENMTYKQKKSIKNYSLENNLLLKKFVPIYCYQLEEKLYDGK